MRLTFQEIRNRAIQFGHDWKDETSERAEAQTFWNEFFNVFGIQRRSVASFERTVKNLSGAYDRIDVIWQGVLIGEHKSRGQDLSKAATQALGYVQSLTRAKRDTEIPQYIVVSDFATIVLHDLDDPDAPPEGFAFPVEDLHKHIRRFDFLNGIQSKPVDPEDPINIEAVTVLGRLHDALERGGYAGPQLERFLVRVLFCMFADDTGIFEPDTFKTEIEDSNEDGSDLGPRLERFFQVLDKPKESRSPKLSDELKNLPYVNGKLFAERLDFAEFDGAMRTELLNAGGFQWAKISPAVFGSLFQSIMAGESGAKKRRQIGAHYTSERDILKLINSLFMDDLRAEFEKLKKRRTDLMKFHDKLAGLKFLDPACGCGNFLVIAYRELRRLEHDVIDTLFPDHTQMMIQLLKLNVDQMYGIEIEEWPARIAEVAMWLIDHQMNLEASQRFGKPITRLPLTKSAKIVHDNALRVDWNNVLPTAECAFVMGNPPYVGKHYRTAIQNEDLNIVFGGFKKSGDLDYVTAWIFTAASYIKESEMKVAFVTTNSITQGEQVPALWKDLMSKRPVVRHFAHRTFRWISEARGGAHVHVVIIGFTAKETSAKFIVDYANDDDSDGKTTYVKSISPYLTDASDTVVTKANKPIAGTPEMRCGNKPSDGGNLLLSPEERAEMISQDADSKQFIRTFVGSEELINGIERYCLWLRDATPTQLRTIKPIRNRIEAVREFRNKSTAAPTRSAAETPTRFFYESQPLTKYIAVPEVSSERREYIPIDILSPKVIASNKLYVIASESLFLFGVLLSKMHMAWMRQTAGRLESRYQYSGSMVYNTYPWPESPTPAQKAAVEKAAQGVLDARAAYPDQTLADLYDPLAMPKPLRDAHRTLDRAVDKCYRAAAFDSDRQRVEYLFGLYEKLTAPLITPEKPKRAKKNAKPE